MRPLDGPRLRIRHAKSDLQTLHDEMRALAGSYEHKVVSAEYDPQRRRYALRMRVPQLPPDDWSVVISGIAHQFRAALDNLTWQLALLTNGETKLLGLRREEKPAFPIYAERKSFHGQGIGCLADPHRTAIELLQPYHAGDKAVRDPLWMLHELNNTDKHRLLVVTAIRNLGYGWASFGPQHCTRPFEFFSPGVDLVDGVQIGWACICRVSRSNVNVHTGQLSDIAFGEGCPAVQRLPVSPALGLIANKVTDIVESFALSLD